MSGKMETYQIAVFIDNAMHVSTVTSHQEAARVFALHVRQHMTFRRDHLDSEFEHSNHFISFRNRYIATMMFGFITEDLFAITQKEVYHILRE